MSNYPRDSIVHIITMEPRSGNNRELLPAWDSKGGGRMLPFAAVVRTALPTIPYGDNHNGLIHVKRKECITYLPSSLLLRRGPTLPDHCTER